MGKIDTNRGSNREKSQKEYFGNKSHTLTLEDRKKGGRRTSDKKTRANGVKNIKTGKYTDKVPHCHTCTRKSRCSYYDASDPKAVCKAISIPNFLQMMDSFEFKTVEEADDFFNILMWF